MSTPARSPNVRPPLASRALASAALLGLIVAAAPARAQDAPAGAVGLHFSFGELRTEEDEETGERSMHADLGGLIGADLWFPIDWLRLGAYLGVGAIPSDVDVRNRIYMPLAASVAAELLFDQVGVSIRARGGLWAGATQEVKITAGGLVGGGLHLLVHLGGGTALSLGMDVWGILGDGETAVFAPGIGLSWNPAFLDAVDEADDGDP